MRVEIEKPIEGGFASAQCLLPDYSWSEVSGFNEEEIKQFQGIIESLL